MVSGSVEYLLKGGPVMYPLFFLAVVAVAVALERYRVIRQAAGNNDELFRQVRSYVRDGRFSDAEDLCDRYPGVAAPLVAAAIRNRHLDPGTIERAMEELALRAAQALQKRLGVLDTVITMAPLLGLLGTVTGMIRAFHVVASANGEATAAITGGVAEALIATATGLTIALLTLPAYNFLTERVKELLGEMETRGTEALNLLAQVRVSDLTAGIR